MNRVVHFEIQADDPLRAIKFYKEVFAWDFEKWEHGDEDYWVIMTAEKGSKELGINGGLLPRPAPVPAKDRGTNAYVCTVIVESFDTAEKKILKAGGSVAMPKFAIPGMAWQGYFFDSEDNVFGIHEPNKDAK